MPTSNIGLRFLIVSSQRKLKFFVPAKKKKDTILRSYTYQLFAKNKPKYCKSQNYFQKFYCRAARKFLYDFLRYVGKSTLPITSFDRTHNYIVTSIKTDVRSALYGVVTNDNIFCSATRETLEPTYKYLF